MPPSSASLLPLGPFYRWMLHTHVVIFEQSSSWGLYCTTLHIIVTIERFVRMCEWTSTSGHVTMRALRVSRRNRKAPLKVFRRSGRPCAYNIQYPTQLLKETFWSPVIFCCRHSNAKSSIDRTISASSIYKGSFLISASYLREKQQFSKYSTLELVSATEGALFLHFQAIKSGVLHLWPKPKIIVIFPLINHAQLKPWLLNIGTSSWKKKIQSRSFTT